MEDVASNVCILYANDWIHVMSPSKPQEKTNGNDNPHE